MPAAKSALRIFGVQAPPVEPVSPPRRDAVIRKASDSLKQATDLLGKVTRELAEGDLELADLIVPTR